MHLETEELLRILKDCSNGHSLFVSASKNQKDLNIWELLQSEGFVHQTGLDEAITTWKNLERRGTPTNQKKCHDCEYAPYRRERKNDSWNPYIQVKRFKYYNALKYFLNKSLQNIEVYALFNSCFRYGERFKIYMVVGQTSNRDWICLAPTVPDQVWSIYENSYHPNLTWLTSCKSTKPITIDLFDKINKILANLEPLEIYGYYHGGYNYSYNHQIFCTASPKKLKAIELALQAGKMLDFDSFWLDKCFGDRSKVKQFMREYLKRRKCYVLSFWDIGYAYEIGCTQSGDWIGVKYRCEFDYNP